MYFPKCKACFGQFNTIFSTTMVENNYVACIQLHLNETLWQNYHRSNSYCITLRTTYVKNSIRISFACLTCGKSYMVQRLKKKVAVLLIKACDLSFSREHYYVLNQYMKNKRIFN